VWILDRGKVVERAAGGNPVRMAGTHTDITARKQAEEALRESESRFRLLASVTAVGIFQTGARGEILFVNSTYLALTGLSEEEAYGPDGKMAIHPEDRERVVREWQEAVSAGIGFSAEYRHLLPDGSVNWVRMLGRPFLDGAGAVGGHVGALVDITEPRALQSQLALASRLAAMGTLVTGVAHEINNPLSAELADQGVALEVVREVRARMGDGSPLDRKAEVRLLDGVVEALEDAQESGQRISRIVKDLAAFGRPDTRRTRVRMIDVVNGALRWLPAAVARTARIQVEDGGAPDVVASSGQIEQVLVNLAINAAFATPEGQWDTVIVRIGPGDRGMARLEVIDHGTGIEPAILDRIFEPFFTTHAVGAGKGMGLGLAIAHAIVTAHGGSLTVASVVGRGSTFRVDLPAAAEDAD
jgi:PAS domain S-box-containing protein